MKRLLISTVLLLLSSCFVALGQVSKSTLVTDINTFFPDNVSGGITPATTRTFLNILTNSFQQFTGVNPQAGTSYPVGLSDYGQVIAFSNSSSIAVTLPSPTGNFTTFNTFISGLPGAGTITIAATGATINGASSIAIGASQSVQVVADGTGTNYVALLGTGSGGGGGTPGGADTQVQFNSSGIFGASSNLTWVTPTLTVGSNGGSTGRLAIAGSGTGSVTQTTIASPGTPTVTWGSSSGTPAVAATAPITITSATGVVACATCAMTSNPLSQFASTTPAQLAGIISGTTGTGSLVFATSPTLVTPVLGVASATSVNKVAITAPATSATLAIADGKALTVSNILTLAGVDSTTITFQGTDTYIGRATTDTLTNKTFDTAGTGNAFKINGTAITAIGGNTATVGTTSGALTTGHCVSIDANANFIDAGGACTTGGGGGTVNSGVAGQLAYYGTSSTIVSGNANATISAGALTLGIATSVQGSLKLSGATSGTTTFAVPSVATGTLTFPATTDTMVARATTDTLTNKTLTSPVIASIVNSGTLTLPTSTDTLVGRATTDTLTNKTLDTAGAGNSFKINGTAITSISGNTAKVATTSGTLTNNDCVSIDASGNLVDAGAACAAGGVSSVFSRSGAVTAATGDYTVGQLYGCTISPQGRLTLTTGTPVMTATASAQTTVYYSPYLGTFVPIYDGTRFICTDTGGELSQLTTDTTKSPNAVAASSCYDVFVWNDSGTIRATRGPAWTSTTARSAGTALARVNGIYTNNVTITNGPAANRGTFVGTFCSNGASSVDWTLGSAASGGSAASLNVWNQYNRVDISTTVIDNGTTYTYTTNTARECRGSTTFTIAFVSGNLEDSVLGEIQVETDVLASAASTTANLGLDSTVSVGQTQPVTLATGGGSSGAQNLSGAKTNIYSPQLGRHTLSCNENSDGAHASSFNFSQLNQIGLKFRM